MTLIELQRALRQLRCSDMAGSLETRLLEAQTDRLAPLDFLSQLVGDELLRRQDRLLERRIKQALVSASPRSRSRPARASRSGSPRCAIALAPTIS